MSERILEFSENIDILLIKGLDEIFVFKSSDFPLNSMILMKLYRVIQPVALRGDEEEL